MVDVLIVTESVRNGMTCWYMTKVSTRRDRRQRDYTFRAEHVFTEIYQHDGTVRFRVSARARRKA